jgi:predicted DNA-binding transcriptional regulator AlpA
MARLKKQQLEQDKISYSLVAPARLLDVDQAGIWLGVSRTQVFEYIEKKGLPVIRLSERVVRFDPNSMYRWALKFQEGIE